MNILDKIIKILEDFFERSTNILMTILFIFAVLSLIICCIAILILGIVWLIIYFST